MKQFPDRLNGKWLIVKPLKKEEETFNGLIIPESANADLSTGEVKMRSELLKDFVKPGEIAIYPSKVGLGQIVNGEAYLWLEEHQVWAIDKPVKNGIDKGDSL